MDFLKLVQKKENKSDNKIIAATVIVVVLIMSLLVFWPSEKKHQVLSYLPSDASFYYHLHNKNYFQYENPFLPNIDNKLSYLENILDSNFLNLQEIIWFKTPEGSDVDNYLLRFSRLPRSLANDLDSNNQDINVSSPAKNILLLTQKETEEDQVVNTENITYFEDGISIYWQKGQAPKDFEILFTNLESFFQTNDVLLNFQNISKDKNRISLLEKTNQNKKDISNFFSLKDSDVVLAFSDTLTDDISQNISETILKSWFESLPYYNLNSEVIKQRIFTDAVLWKRGEGWLLASDKDWQSSILDFIDTFDLEEVPNVLPDGTAYTELVAKEDQSTTEHQINGQKVLQIDKLYVWDIGDYHYLSNQEEIIKDLSSENHYLSNIWSNCLNRPYLEVNDLISLNTSKLNEGAIKDELITRNIYSLQLLSYTTGTISGLDICF